MKLIITILIASLALVGCASVQPKKNELYKGVVFSVDRYQVQQNDPSLGGGLVGAGIGGLLGNQVGRGSGRNAMTILGTVVGAGVGSAAAGSTRLVDMAELVVALDNGKAYQVKQVEKGWYVGQKVVLSVRGNILKLDPM